MANNGNDVVVAAPRRVVNQLLRIEVTNKGITPLLMNRVSEEDLLKIHGKIKAPKGAPRLDPRDEAKKKVYAYDAELKKPYIPAKWLFSSLKNAGRFVRLDGKRQMSTRTETLLPNFLTLEDASMPLETPGWEVDIQQGRNPNGGELVVLVRPRFDAWQFKVNIMIDTREIDEGRIRELFDRAGKQCGLGDFRPNRGGLFGQFIVNEWKRLD